MIRFLLLYRIDWTDAHPRLMAFCAGVCIAIALALDPGAP